MKNWPKRLKNIYVVPLGCLAPPGCLPSWTGRLFRKTQHICYSNSWQFLSAIILHPQKKYEINVWKYPNSCYWDSLFTCICIKAYHKADLSSLVVEIFTYKSSLSYSPYRSITTYHPSSRNLKPKKCKVYQALRNHRGSDQTLNDWAIVTSSHKNSSLNIFEDTGWDWLCALAYAVIYIYISLSDIHSGVWRSA